MRIGEIAVISSGNEEKQLFIKSVCEHLEITTENITFGRFPINAQLVLHLYGLTLQAESPAVAWDLLAQKCLGYIVLFPWQDAGALESLKPVLDLLANKYEATMVVAAHTPAGNPSVPPALFESSIALTAEGKLMFCDARRPASARKVLLALIDSLLDKIA